MKISIDAKEFGRLVKKIMPSIPTKTSIPVLENILFRFDGKEIEMDAANLETYQRINTMAKGEGKGHALIPGDMLNKLIATLMGNLEITFTDKNIIIDSDKGEYKLRILRDIGDYPDFPTFDGTSYIVIAPSIVMEAIAFTKHAVDNTGMRLPLSGVFFEETEKGLNIVATDGRVMAVYFVAGSYGNKNILLSHECLKALEQFIETSEEDFIKLFFDGKMVKVEKEREVLISRVLIMPVRI